VPKIILEGVAKAGEENAEGKGGGQKCEFCPEAGVRIGHDCGEHNEEGKVNEIEGKSSSGDFADDSYG
jgi:hypothetical protein